MCERTISGRDIIYAWAESLRLFWQVVGRCCFFPVIIVEIAGAAIVLHVSKYGFLRCVGELLATGQDSAAGHGRHGIFTRIMSRFSCALMPTIRQLTQIPNARGPRQSMFP